MSKRTISLLVIIFIMAAAAVIITACQPQVAAAQAPVCPTAAPCPACPTCPTETAVTGAEQPAVTVPFIEKWQASAHADLKAPAFTHWDKDGKIPETCAGCHSGLGFMDRVGADGSAADKVDAPATTGTAITCAACHNDATAAMTTVKFPSGKEVTGLGKEAVCMTCHQGTSSKVQVDAAIEKAGVKDEDTVSADLPFTNIHYKAAAAAQYGSEVSGGYEYEGKTYDVKFDHVHGFQTCIDCHDSHSLEVKVESCQMCHVNVKSVEDLKTIREPSSMQDYDGDGDTKEGIAAEVEGINALLLTAIQSYATEVSKTPIAYSPAAYPYFFIDTNKDGKAGDDEAKFANKYNAFTPRLAKAAYNYQAIVKDPGGFAHGGKYLIQLAYDSIESLNEKLTTKVDLAKAVRDDSGHFASASEAWRHWDEEGMVPAGCAKCHSDTGLPQFIKNGANVAVPLSSGLTCSTCHDDFSKFSVYKNEMVTFPSGAKVSFKDAPAANICLNCHQGRESTVSVNKVIKDKDPNKVDESIKFKNVHYFAAGSTLFGTEVKGMYEFDGKTYAGLNAHVDGFATCTDCHDKHGLNVKAESCQGCHQVDDPLKIRSKDSTADYDGDGDTKEGIAGEIETMVEKLFTALKTYSADKLKSPVVYSSSSYPYFFVDTNANGEADADELKSENAYKTWSPKLLQGAYNYQYALKDPGAFAHNPTYVMQVLYDSIEALGGDVKGMTRP